MNENDRRFQDWRIEQIARIQSEEREAQRGLQQCQNSGRTCCAGFHQRVQQAQRHAQMLQNTDTAVAIYNRTVKPARTADSPMPRAGKKSFEY